MGLGGTHSKGKGFSVKFAWSPFLNEDPKPTLREIASLGRPFRVYHTQTFALNAPVRVSFLGLASSTIPLQDPEVVKGPKAELVFALCFVFVCLEQLPKHTGHCCASSCAFHCALCCPLCALLVRSSMCGLCGRCVLLLSLRCVLIAPAFLLHCAIVWACCFLGGSFPQLSHTAALTLSPSMTDHQLQRSECFGIGPDR